MTDSAMTSTQGKKSAAQVFSFSFQLGWLMNFIWPEIYLEISWELNKKSRSSAHGESQFLFKTNNYSFPTPCQKSILCQNGIMFDKTNIRYTRHACL